MTRSSITCLLAVAASVLTAVAAPTAASAADPVLDLEWLTGLQAEKMMEDGELTSVQLTRAYIDADRGAQQARPGPQRGHAAQPGRAEGRGAADKERAHGPPPRPGARPADPAQGPDRREGHVHVGRQLLAARLLPARRTRASRRSCASSGVVILGKLGLSEFANSFGSQPSGFCNLTGQVLNALDADQGPSGSSSGIRRGRRGRALDADDRHRDVRLDHQPVATQRPRRPAARPSGSSPATASRRSRPRRTPPARWTAPSQTRR